MITIGMRKVRVEERGRGRGVRNLIFFLESLGRDISNKISENDVTTIITNYIRENPLMAKKRKTKTKTVVACDERLRLLFERREINIVKLPDLVAKLYATSSSVLSDDDFSKVDMEEKVPSLHEDVTKHSRLLHEVPEVVAEELEPECVNDDKKIENDFIGPNSEASFEAHQSDREQQLTLSASSAGDKDLHGGAFEPPANGITQSKESIIEEVEMMILDKQPPPPTNPIEIINLTDDDDDEDNKNNRDDKHYDDPTKVLWFYEFPKGQIQGPFSITDLKKWNDDEYFTKIPDFKVWMRGESAESAVSLTKLLSYLHQNLTEI